MVSLALINVRCFQIAVSPCALYIHPLASLRWRYSFLGSRYNVFSTLLLFAIDNLLLGVTSLRFTAHLLFGSCFSLVASSLSSLSLAAYRSLAQCSLHAIGYSPLVTHGLPLAFLGVRHSSVANRRALVDSS